MPRLRHFGPCYTPRLRRMKQKKRKEKEFILARVRAQHFNTGVRHSPLSRG